MWLQQWPPALSLAQFSMTVESGDSGKVYQQASSQQSWSFPLACNPFPYLSSLSFRCLHRLSVSLSFSSHYVRCDHFLSLSFFSSLSFGLSFLPLPAAAVVAAISFKKPSTLQSFPSQLPILHLTYLCTFFAHLTLPLSTISYTESSQESVVVTWLLNFVFSGHLHSVHTAYCLSHFTPISKSPSIAFQQYTGQPFIFQPMAFAQ